MFRKLIVGLVVLVMSGVFVPFAVATTSVYNIMALNKGTDLVNPTSDQNYPLGARVVIYDNQKTALKEYVYVKAASALSQYGVYNVTFSSVAAAEVTTGTPAASTGAPLYSGVAPAAFTSGYYGFVQIAGDCTVSTGTAVTMGNYVRVLSGAATAGDTGGTTISSTTFGIWKSSTYGSSTATMYLLGIKSYAW